MGDRVAFTSSGYDAVTQGNTAPAGTPVEGEVWSTSLRPGCLFIVANNQVTYEVERTRVMPAGAVQLTLDLEAVSA